jgi:hypothetical protein
MNVEIGAEAAQFLDKEYVNGIFVAVRVGTQRSGMHRRGDKKHGIGYPRQNVQGHIDQGHNIKSPVKGCDQYIVRPTRMCSKHPPT